MIPSVAAIVKSAPLDFIKTDTLCHPLNDGGMEVRHSFFVLISLYIFLWSVAISLHSAAFFTMRINNIHQPGYDFSSPVTNSIRFFNEIVQFARGDVTNGEGWDIFLRQESLMVRGNFVVEFNFFCTNGPASSLL